MPGPVHLLYGFAWGTVMMHLTEGKFRPYHVFVLGISTFVGPDIGSFVEWLCKDIFPSFGDFAIYASHELLLFVLLFSYPLALFHHRLSFYEPHLPTKTLSIADQNISYDLSSKDKKVIGVSNVLWIIKSDRSQITLPHSWYLVIAGALHHFMFDFLFENQGNTKQMKWILATGYWGPAQPIDFPLVFIPAILFGTLLVGWLYFNSASYRSQGGHAPFVSLLAVISSLYFVFVAYRTYVGPEAAIGEEAELGVMLFIGLYVFGPTLLCMATAWESGAQQISIHDYV